MARITTRPELKITLEEQEKLVSLMRSRTESGRRIQRAEILHRYFLRESFTTIALAVGTTRRLVYQCVDRALEAGIEVGLRDAPHGMKPNIDAADRAWALHIACSKPKDLGLAAELWTRQALADYFRAHAEQAGHPSLKRACKSMVQRLLTEGKVRPHKIKYYLHKRDPAFDEKMRQILLVYQEIDQLLDEEKGSNTSEMITVAVDEKPGVQALINTAPDLPPVSGKHPEVARDHEYKRDGTASILAAIDLHDGHITARVERRHRSCEFVDLLKDLDAHYPPEVTLRLILDNHSSHLSKETRAYLATRPNRFVYILTPTHGSWLNLAETFFSKISRSFLRGIRVTSWSDLKRRILQGIAEINLHPVVIRWKNFDALHVPVS